MIINETQKRILDALNQRKYLKLSNGIEVKAIELEQTILTVDMRNLRKLFTKMTF